MTAISPPETIRTSHHRVYCDGSGQVDPALGHPRVYYQIDDQLGFVDCGYCDRRFVAATAPGDEDEQLAPGVYEGSAGH